MLVRSSFDHLVYTPVRGFHAAASVANLILTAAVTVTQLPEDKPAQGGGDHHGGGFGGGAEF
jgi:hypothetical protein